MRWNIASGVFSGGSADISNGISVTALNWIILDAF